MTKTLSKHADLARFLDLLFTGQQAKNGKGARLEPDPLSVPECRCAEDEAVKPQSHTWH